MNEVVNALLAVIAIFVFAAGGVAFTASIWPGEPLSIKKLVLSIVFLSLALYYYRDHTFAGNDSVSIVAVIIVMLAISFVMVIYVLSTQRSKEDETWFEGKKDDETEEEFNNRVRSVRHDNID